MSSDLSDLSLVELFDQLTQPEPPPPVSMWPATEGWIWLGAFVLIVTALATWRLIAWRRATAYRRAALAALQGAGDNPAEIAVVLRRTALSCFPRETVAGLHGSAWLMFLDGACDRVRFSGTSAGEVLTKAPFTTQSPDPELRDMARTWIRTHRRQEASV